MNDKRCNKENITTRTINNIMGKKTEKTDRWRKLIRYLGSNRNAHTTGRVHSQNQPDRETKKNGLK